MCKHEIHNCQSYIYYDMPASKIIIVIMIMIIKKIINLTKIYKTAIFNFKKVNLKLFCDKEIYGGI